MPVQNVECQIAEMQIGRYLSGEQFSTEAVRQLEAHVSQCTRCAGILSERKAALKAMLKKEARAVVSLPEPRTKSADENPLLNAIKEKTNAWTTKKPVPATPTPAAVPTAAKKPFSKPLILSGALAVVLVGMSYFSHSQENILGESADKALPKKSKPVLHSKTPHKASVLATPPAKTPLRDNPTEESTVGASPKDGDLAKPLKDGQTTKSPVQPFSNSKIEPVAGSTNDTSTSQVDDNASEEQTTAPATSPRHIRRKGSAPAKRSPKRATTHHRIADPAPKSHRTTKSGVRVSSSVKVYSPDGDPIQ